MGKQTLGGHKQNTVCTRTQDKGAVAPQETDPDLPVNVQESPGESWVGGGLLQCWGGTKCSSAHTGQFEGGRRYLKYLHHPLVSVDGWSCVPSLLFTWGQTMVEVTKTMATSFKRSHACTATLSAPNPAAEHHRPTLPLESPGHSRASLGSLLWGHCSFLLGPGAHKILFVPSKSLFPSPV